MSNKIKLKEIRTSARESVRNAGASPRIVTLIFLGCIYGTGILLDSVQYVLNLSGSGGISDTIRLQTISSVFTAAGTVLTLFSIIWDNCYLGYARALSRNEAGDFGTITGYLHRSGTFFGTRVLTAVYIGLWTLLFMIPGYYLTFQATLSMELTEDMLLDYDAAYTAVESYLFSSPLLPWIMGLIALGILAGAFMSYRYRLAPYFALEPNFRARACVRASKAVMRGHMWQLFRLDLSLLWYYILTGLLSYGLTVLVMFVELSDGWILIAEIAFYLLLLAVQIFAYPFVQCCYAGYADRLMLPRMNPEPRTIPESTQQI